jgi:hypothetical protein
VTGTEDETLTETTAPARAVPPDPAEYDTERAAAARRRGLPAPYIPGGRDPEQAAADREERRWLRLLLLMVVVVVAAGFVFGFLAAALGFDFLVGTPS